MAALAWWTSEPVVLSRPPVRGSDLIVRGRILPEQDGKVNHPSNVWIVQVDEVLKGRVAVGEPIRVAAPAEVTRWATDRSYLFPLMRAGEDFQVTRFPLDAPARIYPATPSTIEQLRRTLSHAPE